MSGASGPEADERCGGPLVTRRTALSRALAGTLALAAATACRDGDDAALDSGSGTAPATGDTAPTEPGQAATAPAPDGAPLALDSSNPAGRPVLDRDADVHVLRRLAYGPTERELAHLRSVGVDAWLDEQLDADTIDTSEVDGLLAEAFPELDTPAAELLAAHRTDPAGPELAAVLPGAALVRNARSPAQLRERLVEFWGDHFNVPQAGPPSTIVRIVMDREVFRRHGLGRFDDLLVATAQSPAMLTYLDNFRSRAGSTNENYARELLELHTVGIDGGYDETDIQNVARLLTGWTIDRDLEFRFAERNHDSGRFSILGWDRPATGDPRTHGEEFLRHLARLPSTAENVCRKLAVRFVADEPDDQLVAAMTAAWDEHDTAIAPVISAMVGHPAFQTAPMKFNRPWDYLIQTLRSLGATVDAAAPYDRLRAYGAVRDLGQVPFRWPSPDGYPDVGSAWMNAGGLLARWNLTAALTLGDEMFDAGLGDRLVALGGATAREIYDRLAAELRHEPLTDEQTAEFGDLTSWDLDHAPTEQELTRLGPLVAFVLLAGPAAHFR